MAPEDGVSSGELGRRIDALGAEVDRRFKDVNSHLERRFSELSQQMKEMTFVPRELFIAEVASLRREALAMYDAAMAAIRVVENEQRDAAERETWRNRALVVSFIFPVLLLMLGAYFITGPK